MSTRTQPDALTIAFIAIGASKAFDHCPVAERTDKWGGYLEYIESLTQHALMLDTLADPVDAEGGFTDVFCYAVAEKFGEIVGSSYVRGDEFEFEILAQELIEEASE